jgi:hypothetical protein
MAALMTAIVPGSAWTTRAAGTAFESRSGAASALVGASAPSAIVAAAIASSTAKGALESRTRISADACGIAREIFARSRRASAARGASFAGKQDDVFLGRRRRRGVFAGGGCGDFVLRGFGLGMFAGSGGMFGAFMGRVGFRFGEIVRFRMVCFVFLFFGLFLGDLYIFGGVNFLGVFFRLFLGLFFDVILFELGAADHRVHFGFRLGFFVLGFHEARRQGYGFFVAKRGFGSAGFWLNGFLCRRRLQSGGGGVVCGSSEFVRARRCICFGAAFGKKPARQSARMAARNTCSGGRSSRLGSSGARRCFLLLYPGLVRLVLDNRGGRGRDGLVAILRERFTGKDNRFFGGLARSRRSGVARTVRAAIVKATLLWAPRFEPPRLLAALIKPTRVLRSAGILWATRILWSA